MLRRSLVSSLKQTIPEIELFESVANFVLVLLPPQGPDAATVVESCRAHDVYLRDAGRTSNMLGTHALRIAVKDESTNLRIVKRVGEAILAG